MQQHEAPSHSGHCLVAYGKILSCPDRSGGFHVRGNSSGESKVGYSRRTRSSSEAGCHPDHQQCPGFLGYYVVYAPDDTVTAISVFNSVEGAQESNRRALAWIDKNLGPLLVESVTATAGPVIAPSLPYRLTHHAAMSAFGELRTGPVSPMAQNGMT